MKLRKLLDKVLQAPFLARQERLIRNRRDSSRAEFISSFSARETDLAAHVWQALRVEAVVPDFRPDPRDDLCEVYGLAEGDLDDFVLDLLNAFNCRVPDPTETAGMRPVRTVADVVSFASRFRSDGRGR